jgi:nicotinamide-nucleotide amidase
VTREALPCALARSAGEALLARGERLVTAESCTGGGLAFCLTEIPGSSGWFEGGFVTYSNESKRALLGVREETLRLHGAVSEATVREMAQGALDSSAADAAIAISGVAGPDGGTPDKPVGTVCLAWQRRGKSALTRTRHFAGDRHAVRVRSIEEALRGLLALYESG